MRILIVSEGKNELGHDNDDKRAALVTLVSRLLNQPNVEYRTESIRHPDFGPAHGAGGRLFKRAMRCVLRARQWGFQGLIIVIDEDGDRERHAQFDKAQDNLLDNLPRALGIAVRKFDAWMLADEQTLSSVIGTTIQRQPDPETIADPKAHCRDLRTTNQLHPSLTEMYKSIAEVANLEIIAARCPSFEKFASRVRSLAPASPPS